MANMNNLKNYNKFREDPSLLFMKEPSNNYTLFINKIEECCVECRECGGHKDGCSQK